MQGPYMARRLRSAENLALAQGVAELAAGDNEHCKVGSGSNTQFPDQRLGRRKGCRVRSRPSANRIFRAAACQYASCEIGLQRKEIVDCRFDSLFLPRGLGP